MTLVQESIRVLNCSMQYNSCNPCTKNGCVWCDTEEYCVWSTPECAGDSFTSHTTAGCVEYTLFDIAIYICMALVVCCCIACCCYCCKCGFFKYRRNKKVNIVYQNITVNHQVHSEKQNVQIPQNIINFQQPLITTKKQNNTNYVYNANYNTTANDEGIMTKGRKKSDYEYGEI